MDVQVPPVGIQEGAWLDHRMATLEHLQGLRLVAAGHVADEAAAEIGKDLLRDHAELQVDFLELMVVLLA